MPSEPAESVQVGYTPEFKRNLRALAKKYGETFGFDAVLDAEMFVEEQAAWFRLTAEQFLAGYSEADSIYDRI